MIPSDEELMKQEQMGDLNTDLSDIEKNIPQNIDDITSEDSFSDHLNITNVIKQSKEEIDDDDDSDI